MHDLDLVVKADLGRGFSLGAKGTNLLDSPVRYAMGDSIVEDWRDGVGFALAISWEAR